MDRRGFLRLCFGAVAAAALPKIPGFDPVSHLGAGVLTIADVVRTMPADGNAAAIVSFLSDRNPLLDDIPWLPHQWGEADDE